jgi:hypothetical protein
MLVRLGWFPNKRKALKRLGRLRARGRIRLVGTVARKAGRPEYVFSRYRLKADQLIHEVELTEICLRLHAEKILRGTHIADRHRLPDAEVWINKCLYYLELDRGTMGYAQIDRRFRLYEGCPHLTLWICASVERLESMRRRAERIRGAALFTTLAEAMQSPHGEIWIDFRGDRARLPKEADDHPA